MVIFHSYVSLPEGNHHKLCRWCKSLKEPAIEDRVLLQGQFLFLLGAAWHINRLEQSSLVQGKHTQKIPMTHFTPGSMVKYHCYDAWNGSADFQGCTTSQMWWLSCTLSLQHFILQIPRNREPLATEMVIYQWLFAIHAAEKRVPTMIR